jgi:hypothetical protein
MHHESNMKKVNSNYIEMWYDKKKDPNIPEQLHYSYISFRHVTVFHLPHYSCISFHHITVFHLPHYSYISFHHVTVFHLPHYSYISFCHVTVFHLPHCTRILNMTWYMRCRIKLKQWDEHLFYILICALAKKLNFSLIVTPYQHKYCILLMLCIYYLFLCVFYLRHIQFLRQYSPYPVPLTLSCAYVYTSRKVVCYGWVLFACSYYCCFLFQI